MSPFVGIPRAMRLVNVSRSTIYYWMEHGWVHWQVLPNRRRVVCVVSLRRFGLAGGCELDGRTANAPKS